MDAKAHEDTHCKFSIFALSQGVTAMWWKLTGQFTDKPTCSQSSGWLV